VSFLRFRFVLCYHLGSVWSASREAETLLERQANSLPSVDEDSIDDQCDALRKKLTTDQARNGGGPSARGLKSHQVHELAKAKIEESERLRRALGISKDYEEGSHWKRQEERAAEKEKIVKEKARERSVSRSRSRSRSRSSSRSRSLSRSRSR